MWVKTKTPFATPISEPPTDHYVCRRLVLPASREFIWLVNGVLSLLLNPDNYTETESGLTADRTAAIFGDMWSNYLGLWNMIGAIVPMLVETLPTNMLWCEGGTVLRTAYPELYAALPAAYRLDADTFTLPDLRNLFIVGAGDTYDTGDTGGSATHQLSVDEMPSHTHTSNPHRHYHMPLVTGDLDVEGIGVPQPNAAQIVPLAQNLTDYETVTNNNTGGGQPHNNLPPFVALRFAIVAKWVTCD